MTRPEETRCFRSVWDALEDTPEAAEQMKARSALMIALTEHMRAKGWTRAEAAREARVPENRITDLFEGNVEMFTLTALEAMVAGTGLCIGPAGSQEHPGEK